MKHIRERLQSAIWFGGFAVLAAASMFLVPSLRRGAWPLFLYVGLPGLAGAASGFAFGWQLIEPGRVRTTLGASARGLLIAAMAFLLYSGLFTLLHVVTAPDTTSTPGLLGASLLIGGLAAGPVVVSVGIVAALLLRRVAGRSIVSRE